MISPVPRVGQSEQPAREKQEKHSRSARRKHTHKEDAYKPAKHTASLLSLQAGIHPAKGNVEKIHKQRAADVLYSFRRSKLIIVINPNISSTKHHCRCS